MIARIWEGRTRPGMGKPYMSYLEQTGLKDYKATGGCRDVLVFTREIGAVTGRAVGQHGRGAPFLDRLHRL